MTVYIIYTKFYDFKNLEMTIGGVQTYIIGLIKVFTSLGYKIKIYQCGDKEESVHLLNSDIYQVDTSNKNDRDKKIAAIVNLIKERFNDEQDILLFMANEIIVPTKVRRSIAIQHGISWDLLSSFKRPSWQDRISFFLKARRAYKIINRIKGVKELVCVDHNFPNWLKSTAVRFYVPMTVIPNFTDIPSVFNKPTASVNIIFARRLFDYRGARLFADSIALVLSKHENVKVTIAGNGPEEKYMRDCLANFSDKVTFIQYRAEDSLLIHSTQHIAVVPTLCSEGTSLSLLEAMAAQCAVVSTDVGGLSNIVIDGYNALYTEPDVSMLAAKIDFLIENPQKRSEIAANAYSTVKNGFSREKWEENWREFIKTHFNNK